MLPVKNCDVSPCTVDGHGNDDEAWDDPWLSSYCTRLPKLCSTERNWSHYLDHASVCSNWVIGDPARTLVR